MISVKTRCQTQIPNARQQKKWKEQPIYSRVLNYCQTFEWILLLKVLQIKWKVKSFYFCAFIEKLIWTHIGTNIYTASHKTEMEKYSDYTIASRAFVYKKVHKIGVKVINFICVLMSFLFFALHSYTRPPLYHYHRIYIYSPAPYFRQNEHLIFAINIIKY